MTKTKKDELVSARVTVGQKKVVNKLTGVMSISTYLLSLIEKDAKKKGLTIINQ